MSRIARVALEGIPYHITQRGNGRQQIFFDDGDYRLYQDLMRSYCEAAGLGVWGYCLMPNHVHLLVTPERGTAMAGAMGRINADFARSYNLKKRSCGHVWQSRYFSTPMEGAHLWLAMAYVERNPVRAGLVQHAEDYAWSSARLRQCGHGGGLIDLGPWRHEYDWARWKTVLETSVGQEAFGLRLQEASRRGRPFGGAEFIEELEKRCGRRLHPLPTGQPKKKKAQPAAQMSLRIGV
jgi:putative transposase